MTGAGQEKDEIVPPRPVLPKRFIKSGRYKKINLIGKLSVLSILHDTIKWADNKFFRFEP